MDHTFSSAFVVLFLVLDPLGNLPLFITLLGKLPAARRRRIVLRESLIAFLILLSFMLMGQGFLNAIHLSERSLEVAGGVILFMVAIRMVFPGPTGMFGEIGEKEPFIFPLAIPLIAGPSALATVLVLASRQPTQVIEWIAALSCAMLVSVVVLLSASRLHKLLGDSVVSGIEKLMGLILTAISVEMILAGVKRYFAG